MRVAFLAIVLSALVSSGCLVVALQPAYDDRSIAFEEALLGRWENPEDGERATIERGEWRSYRITYSAGSATRTFQGNLTKVGAMTLLDLTEMRGTDPGPFLVPVHGLVRIALDRDTLTTSRIDYDGFLRARSARPGSLPANAIDDRRNAVITAPTNELRRWLMRAPADAFGAPETFARKP